MECHGWGFVFDRRTNAPPTNTAGTSPSRWTFDPSRHHSALPPPALHLLLFSMLSLSQSPSPPRSKQQQQQHKAKFLGTRMPWSLYRGFSFLQFAHFPSQPHMQQLLTANSTTTSSSKSEKMHCLRRCSCSSQSLGTLIAVRVNYNVRKHINCET